MSSLTRIRSSKANGALPWPSTPAGKLRSSENAIIQGLCAGRIVLEDQERENVQTLLRQHVDRFQPASDVEFDGDALDLMAAAPSTLIMPRTVKFPNDPSPISEHSPTLWSHRLRPSKPMIPKYLVGVCFSLHRPSRVCSGGADHRLLWSCQLWFMGAPQPASDALKPAACYP